MPLVEISCARRPQPLKAVAVAASVSNAAKATRHAAKPPHAAPADDGEEETAALGQRATEHWDGTLAGRRAGRAISHARHLGRKGPFERAEEEPAAQTIADHVSLLRNGALPSEKATAAAALARLAKGVQNRDAIREAQVT